MKRYIALICTCLVLVIGIGFSIMLFTNSFDSENEIVYTITATENKEIQQKLKSLGYYNGTIDGIIDAKSTQAVKAFQKANGLIPDGVIGAKTLGKLGLRNS